MGKEVDSMDGLKELQELWAKRKDKSGKSLMDELFEMRRADAAKERAENEAWLVKQEFAKYTKQ